MSDPTAAVVVEAAAAGTSTSSSSSSSSSNSSSDKQHAHDGAADPAWLTTTSAAPRSSLSPSSSAEPANLSDPVHNTQQHPEQAAAGAADAEPAALTAPGTVIAQKPAAPHSRSEIPLSERLREVAVNYAPLCVTTFGGPQAHIALMLDLFVGKKKWLTDTMFAELFAISNSLPGPASTQLAFTLSLIRGGALPGVLGFLIWSLPGGIVMASFGYGVSRLGASGIPAFVLHIQNGFAAVAVALVAGAAYKLGNKIFTDKLSVSLGVIGASMVILFPNTAWVIPVVMAFGGIVTFIEGRINQWRADTQRKKEAAQTAAKTELEAVAVDEQKPEDEAKDGSAVGTSGEGLRKRNVAPSAAPAATTATAPSAPASPASPASSATPAAVSSATEEDIHIYFTYTIRSTFILLSIWFVLFIASIFLRSSVDVRPVNVFGTFYFIGSIIYGGGPVVVPLSYGYVVPNGWLTPTEFLMGLAIINAMPGPNFNFAAFCGALAFRGTVGTSYAGALLGWVGIFLPGLLIKAAFLPVWKKYRGFPMIKTVFRGFNSVAVGLVFSAVFLLWQKSLSITADNKPFPSSDNADRALGNFPFYVAVTAVAFVAIEHIKVPPPFVVIAGGVVGVLEWLVARTY
ncbi:chromate transporter-domain-containing protein [Zopfochytrium polystomum]|nr:chromate transporter-domain-containing protein [Zopfochytrium polystomum]